MAYYSRSPTTKQPPTTAAEDLPWLDENSPESLVNKTSTAQSSMAALMRVLEDEDDDDEVDTAGAPGGTGAGSMSPHLSKKDKKRLGEMALTQAKSFEKVLFDADNAQEEDVEEKEKEQGAILTSMMDIPSQSFHDTLEREMAKPHLLSTVVSTDNAPLFTRTGRTTFTAFEEAAAVAAAHGNPELPYYVTGGIAPRLARHDRRLVVPGQATSSARVVGIGSDTYSVQQLNQKSLQSAGFPMASPSSAEPRETEEFRYKDMRVRSSRAASPSRSAGSPKWERPRAAAMPSAVTLSINGTTHDEYKALQAAHLKDLLNTIKRAKAPGHTVGTAERGRSFANNMRGNSVL